MAKLIFGFVLIFIIGQVSCQRRPGPPPLPPFKMPLLPPVPSQELIDKLTKAQLAFIRQHQKIQEADTTDYTPYACLPKYICIVEDETGKKRTTVVNGLHPVLRENNFRTSIPQDEDKHDIRNLALTNPEAFYKNQVRLNNDEFLRNQEQEEQLALEREDASLREKQESKEESAEGDSGNESNEDTGSKSAESGEYLKSHAPPKHQQQQQQNKDYSGDKPIVNPDFHFDRPIASVPWDDRPKNNTGRPEPSGGLVSKLKSVLPLPKITFIKGPFSSNNRGRIGEPATTQRSILRRMLGGSRLFRGKRQANLPPPSKKQPFITKLGPGIKSSDQCRVLYNGCDLSYDNIMQIAGDGKVLIEGDDPTTKKPFAGQKEYIKPEDDEVDQAMKDRVRPTLLNNNVLQYGTKHPSEGGFYKVKHPKGSKYGNAQSEYNKNKKKPGYSKPHEDEVDNIPVASLPVLPMRFTWGKPQYYVNGKPQYPDIYGIDSRKPTPPSTPPPPTKKPSPQPIFVKKPLYSKHSKLNRTVTQTNIIKLNSTHALQIKTPKTQPYRPDKLAQLDKNGNLASFASVFTEIAGSSGGIHDYFDKIANSVGGPPSRRVQKQFPRPAAPPPLPPKESQGQGRSSEEEEDPSQNTEGQDNRNENAENDDESDEEEEEEDEPQQDEQQEEQQEDEQQEDEQQQDSEDPPPGFAEGPQPQNDEEEVEEDDVAAPSNDQEQEVEEVEEVEEVDDSPSNDEQPEEEEEEEEVEEEATADDTVDEPQDEVQDDEPVIKVKKPGKYTIKSKNKKQGNKKNKPVKKVEDDEEEQDDGFEPDTSEEKKKRIKAAEEVELPEFLPESVKQAIKLDIINGGKKKKGQEGQDGDGPEGMEQPGGPQPLNDDESQEFNGPPGSGGPPGQGPPQGSFGRPPPRRPGLFSGLFGRH